MLHFLSLIFYCECKSHPCHAYLKKHLENIKMRLRMRSENVFSSSSDTMEEKRSHDCHKAYMASQNYPKNGESFRWHRAWSALKAVPSLNPIQDAIQNAMWSLKVVVVSTNLRSNKTTCPVIAKTCPDIMVCVCYFQVLHSNTLLGGPCFVFGFCFY